MSEYKIIPTADSIEDITLALNIDELNRLKNYEYFWKDAKICKKKRKRLGKETGLK